jgi:uncharacterized protein YjiS (DUF1127 family)
MNSYHDVQPSARSRQGNLSEAIIFLARVQKQFGRIGGFWTAHRQRQREAQQLSAFSDRELWDLGLGRSDLPRIANGSFRRDGQ